MGAPFHAWREYFDKHQIKYFSSNYTLYGDMSHRVMTLLQMLCADTEIYSIDEAFLNLETMAIADYAQYAEHVRNTIKTCTSIPVSVGIGPSKTLAKIANKIAKKQKGVCNLMDVTLREKILQDFPVQDIWGVGRRLSERLIAMNIHTARELRDADLKHVRASFSVVMEKTVRELRGIACLPLEIFQPKKEIMSSRSFGSPVSQLIELEEAVSHYAGKACVKLRKQQSVAAGVYVFLQTNPYKIHTKQYANSASTLLVAATDHTGLITTAALKCLRRIYKKGYLYKKAGIMLLDLSPASTRQADLFYTPNNKQDLLMQMLDAVNSKFGKRSLYMASEGTSMTWRMRCDNRSPNYTTSWQNLARVRG